jgi:S1-C subfamily serine protease
MVREITAQLIIYGKMRRGVLGVVTQGLTPQSADAFGIRRRHGVVIAPVEADSPAVHGTFKSGDVVVSVSGRYVADAIAMRNVIVY